MNAIVSLCHFCEIHGPSVICCTQAFHSPEPEEYGDVAEANSHTYDGEPNQQQTHPPNSWDCLQESWNSEKRTSVTSVSAPSSPTSACADRLKTDTCDACNPFTSAGPGFISRDVETGVCYVTTHQPRNAEVFSIVRQACLRSLSCEMCPGREGPIFFGDDHRSQVLSHAFFIKDSNARGFERLFSITVVMMDKIFLLNSWPFLVKHLHMTIEFLKTKSVAVYNDECARCPQRVNRMPAGCAPTSRNFRLQRGCGIKATRSLAELTSDCHVYERLHRAFTWILRAGGSRLAERLVDGPVIEGNLVDINRSEETEEGFVKVFSQKGVTVDQTVYRDVDLHDNTHRDTMSQQFVRLKTLARLLDTQDLHVLAHNILIGNQLIVRYDHRPVVQALLDCLQIMLPKGCCRTVYNSNEYVPSYKCNFLGVSCNVVIPLDTALCVVIEVSDASFDVVTNNSHMSSSGPHSILGHVEDESIDLNAYRYKVICSTKIVSTKEPTLLANIEKTLRNDSLADVVLEQSLVCLKEDWINKAKRWFMFSKVGTSRSKEEIEKLMEVIKVHENDKILLKFWMSALSVKYQLNTTSTLQDTAAI